MGILRRYIREALDSRPIRLAADIPIPDDLQKLSDLFSHEREELYIVGGAVRDALLNKAPKDYDLATGASPESVIDIVSRDPMSKVDLTGKSFGVVRVWTEAGNEYEIATFRRDIGSGRRPDAVEFTSIQDDVKRRDLTINALFYDMQTREVVDYVGGIEDIKNGIVRAVGDPRERFQEDKLRILRAVRFAGRMGSELDPSTKAAILEDNDLTEVSPERIRDEFIKGIVSSQQTSRFLNMVEELRLYPQILPGLQFNPNTGTDSKDVSVQLSLALTNNDPKLVEQVLKNMRYTNDEISEISFLLNFSSVNKSNAPAMKKEFNRIELEPTKLRDFSISAGIRPKVVSAFISFAAAPPAADAKALMTQGLKGPEIGAAMQSAESDAYVETLGELRKYVRSTLKEYLTSFDVEDVYSTSRLAHLGQKRRSGEDYFTHPVGVAKLVRKFYPKDTKAYLVALLHDTLEDAESVGNVTVSELEQMLSGSFADPNEYKQVINAVRALTHDKSIDYNEYVKGLVGNPLALKVKLADMIHNLGDNPSSRQKEKYGSAVRDLVGSNRNLPGISSAQLSALLDATDVQTEYRKRIKLNMLTEITKLPREYFKVIDDAISSSRFWEKPNDDVDDPDSDGPGRTPAAAALQAALQRSFDELDLDIEAFVTSYFTADPNYMLHPDHPAYPNRWLIDASWYVSKQKPGQNVIDLEIMLSDEDSGFDDADIDPPALVRHISQTIRHELVHYNQMKKQSEKKGLDDIGAFQEMLQDPKQIANQDDPKYWEVYKPTGELDDSGKEIVQKDGFKQKLWATDYLRSHIEIDAHAHDAAEELLAVYGEDGAMDVIRGTVNLNDPKLPNALQHYYETLPKGDPTLDKLKGKIYKYIQYFSEEP